MMGTTKKLKDGDSLFGSDATSAGRSKASSNPSGRNLFNKTELKRSDGMITIGSINTGPTGP